MPENSAHTISKRSYRWLAALLLVAIGGVIAFVAVARGPAKRTLQPVRTATAVGDSACISCHREKSSFEQTAHRLTMRLPTRQSILGSFRAGENVLHTANPNMHFRMTADSGGFYQTLVTTNGPDSSARVERVAYVAGSGRRGQSFLYWSGDRLFQMPVSYWTSLGKWIGSPGRADVDPRASFSAAVAARCLECHSTWIESTPDLRLIDHFDAKTAILGITCERCHASGQQHVAREQSLLRSFVRDRAIVNPARLPRERKMELCAQCHGGIGESRTPTFTFVAGRVLDNYWHMVPRASDETVDIHGNQVTLLARSRCYTQSQMTCTTCHDVHSTQRNVVEISGRCLTCHQEQSCRLFPKQGHALAGRCVNCHMPLQTSNLVVSDLEGTMERVQGRTHWIRVYPETAK